MATQQDLDNLRKAMNNGVERVQEGNKTVTYRSIDEMQRRERAMMKELGLLDAPKRRSPPFYKGL